ncbi:YggS family pyridoxal phosphate-dependent enzyme [Sporosarcina thermotolerans]|uniref:Pyridoxal phosphate homeostasis protein n=1 Tax=Sporosarcina thermotolerans TaxID=633404 RepID=A0AAW9A823_9BACL|nr:YggS family pyridoxal phosphate-dependent enzyme [Sporosarcina thermotolerans]MDW0115806.1 YggS family pyridoxal phosphate-dependent enzyme [Sporosarcina thermotolerans]WHT46957.1 YggS family pyridoxal phosphate-dependent enzyme [Sporosarcina thermotolerans]
METLQQRMKVIEEEIQAACTRSGRKRNDITVIAVTKQVSVERTQEVIKAGIDNLGENRPEGLLGKQEEITLDTINWHFIGNVQSRKVKDIIDKVDFLHSLDRITIAKEIQKRAASTIDCFLQVNVSGEESKSGIQPEELKGFLRELSEFDKIRVIGLMTMAPFTEDEDLIRSVFRSLRVLRDQIAALNLINAPCTELSMGMSNDYTIAIEEGATHIRIGTALVGLESEGDG